MLSIYSQSMRPEKELEAIVLKTACFEETILKKWQKISTSDTEYVHIILSGEVEFRRESDELCMFTIRDKSIFCLSAIFHNETHMYGLVRSNAVVRTIRKEDFIRLLNEHNLWEALSNILAWYVCLLSKRDQVLVARSAYAIVREFLLEINELIVRHDRDINIYDYIQEYTNLARSTIIKILADLKRGEYIEVEKGRLLNITSLPEKY